MSCVDFRIIDHNYLFQDNVELTPTSESTEFPASNLARYFRSKTWRTSGYFKITSTNNKIDFKTSAGGPEKTASLTAGGYSPASLAAHIQSKMNLADGVNTYTVTFRTDGRWSIQTSGAFLSLLFLSGSNSLTSAGPSIGFASEDCTGDTVYLSASIAIHTEEALLIDLQTAEEIDSFAIVFDPVLKNSFSAEALMWLQASATDHWDAPAVSVSISLDETTETITHFFTTAQEYRFWRLKVIDKRNPNLFVEVPKIILGKKINLPRAPDIGFNISFEDQSKKNVTQFGHEYVDVLPLRARFSFDYSILTSDQIEEIWKSFSRVGSSVPIFLCVDTTEELFSKGRFSIYGKYSQASEGQHVVFRYFRHRINVVEAF